MQKKLKWNERIRLICQAISFAFHNGYLRGWSEGKIYAGVNKTYCVPGLNCYSCPGAIGACPIGSLQAVLDSGLQPYSLYVFGFIGTIGALCGRLVCGWLCPFGLVQDLLYKIPIFKKAKNMPGHGILKYLKFVILALFVVILPMVVVNKVGVGSPWFCEYICPSGTLLGGIPLVILNPSMRSSLGARFAWKMFLLLGTVILSVKFFRPFCKYVCPLGALYGCGNCISVYRLKVDTEKCVQCGSCQQACGMDIKVWEKPNSMECIRCGRCKAVCPQGAITGTVDDVVKLTGFTKKHKAIDCNAISPPDKLQKYMMASGLLLLVSGMVVTGVVLYNNIWALIQSGVVEDRLLFAAYGLLASAALVPAMINMVFGVKILRHYKNTDRSEELLECTVMAGKFVAVALIGILLFVVFLILGIGGTLNALIFIVIGMVSTGGIAIPICDVVAYFVLKKGIQKCSKEKE